MYRIIKKFCSREFIRKVDTRYGIGALERIFFVNWFNPFATIWLNLRSFPFLQAFCFPIFVYGRPRLYCLSGTMEIIGNIRPGMIRFNNVLPTSPSNMGLQSEIYNEGKILFRGKGRIGTGNRIRVAPGKILDIGANFKIADCVNISCYAGIKIGAQSRVAHRCQVMDANYHYVANFVKRIVPKWTKPIIIGNGCWICNTSTLTGGTVLPDFTIVASNSLVGKDMSSIPESSMIGGIPAKLIATGFRRVENRNIERNITHYYKEYPDGIYQIGNEESPDIYSQIIEK